MKGLKKNINNSKNKSSSLTSKLSEDMVIVGSFSKIKSKMHFYFMIQIILVMSIGRIFEVS